MASASDADLLIAVEGLTIDFHVGSESVHAVRGVDFTLGSNETLALVGESGSGKSTTVRAILGLLPQPMSKVVGGSIRYRGQELLGLSARGMSHIRGSEIGIVFQQAMGSLDPLMTVERQIAEAVRVRRSAPSSAVRARVLELLEAVGISDPERRAKSYPFELSGGARQRIAIAMALAGEPKVLIADEPTTALDVTTQLQILRLLKQVTAEFGTSMLLVTHDLGVVASIADRVAVMREGEVVESGDVTRVYAAPSADYTKELLAATPRLDRPDSELRTLEVP
jgi:ABC-type dipeptide/oligopeptide/nickel transport system ATPase component